MVTYFAFLGSLLYHEDSKLHNTGLFYGCAAIAEPR